jgi:hypothetical protein
MDDQGLGNALMVTALVLALAALLAAPAHAGPIDDDGNTIVHARDAAVGVDTAATPQTNSPSRPIPRLGADVPDGAVANAGGYGWPTARAESDGGAIGLFRQPLFALAALGLTAAATAGLLARHRRTVAMP